jgi:hypothetical protein
LNKHLRLTQFVVSRFAADAIQVGYCQRITVIDCGANG